MPSNLFFILRDRVSRCKYSSIYPHMNVLCEDTPCNKLAITGMRSRQSGTSLRVFYGFVTKNRNIHINDVVETE